MISPLGRVSPTAPRAPRRTCFFWWGYAARKEFALYTDDERRGFDDVMHLCDAIMRCDYASTTTATAATTTSDVRWQVMEAY